MSGDFFLQGLYPLDEITFDREVSFWRQSNHSPLTGTTYESILKSLEQDRGDTCPAKPVQQIPHTLDTMMHTRNCQKVHRFINDPSYDIDGVEQGLTELLGQDYIDDTR